MPLNNFFSSLSTLDNFFGDFKRNPEKKFGPFGFFPVGATGVNERTSEQANELKRKNITSA